MDRSTMYSNVAIMANNTNNINGGPPPLVPMSNSVKTETTEPVIKIEQDINTKRRRPQTTNNCEPHPFVQNVQIDLKALSAKKEKLKSGISNSASMENEDGCHDYSSLLLHSTSSVVRDAAAQNSKKSHGTKENTKHKECIELLLEGRFDEVIAMVTPYIPEEDKVDYEGKRVHHPHHQNGDNELNEYRLLMATALFYRNMMENGKNDSLNALHFCNLIVSTANEGDVEYYESRKIRGLIHKKLRNYKAACHDFEYICYQNPYHRTWRDKLYALLGKSNYFENDANCAQQLQQQPKFNEIMTANSNFFPSQALLPSPHPLQSDLTTMNLLNNVNVNAMDISNPNAPIKFIPSIMSRNKKPETIKANEAKNASMMMEPSLLDTTFSDLQQIQPPKDFPPRSSSTASNGSFDGLLALAHAASTEYDKKQKKEKPKKDDLLSGLDSFPSVMTRKTTMEELLGTLNDNDHINDTMNATPEPMERIRSDALV